jgi:hypothetical protein
MNSLIILLELVLLYLGVVVLVPYIIIKIVVKLNERAL